MIELLFELSLDMVCVAGADGRFLKVNGAWTACLGFTAQELTAVPWLEFVHPDDRSKTVAAAQRMASGGLIGFENRYRSKAGGYRYLSWRSSPWSAGRTLAVARDLGPAPT